MITFLVAVIAVVIGFIMGANAAKSKIMHDIEMGFLDAEMHDAISWKIREIREIREIRAQEQEEQEQRDYQSNGRSNRRTVDGAFHRME